VWNQTGGVFVLRMDGQTLTIQKGMGR